MVSPPSLVQDDNAVNNNYGESDSGVLGETTPLLISVDRTTTAPAASNGNSIPPSPTETTTTTSPNNTNNDQPTTTTAASTNSNTTSGQRVGNKPKESLSSPPSYLQRKAQEIELLLSQEEIDLWKLRDFCLSPGGLVNDTIRKRAWPKLVGLDHKYDPLPLDNVLVKKHTDSNNKQSSDATTVLSPPQPQTPTIEIDAQHELRNHQNNSSSGAIANTSPDPQSPSKSTATQQQKLIVESMDSSQIDRDVARCTWHLLTGSQRSRRSQHRSIKRNSTRGTGYARQTTTSTQQKNRIPRNSHSKQHSAKYKRNRKVAILLKKKQHRLANLINLTLVQSYDRSDISAALPSMNRLRYYQGYHDVACIFLHALGGAGSKNDSDETSNANGNAAGNAKPKSPQRKTRVYQHYSSGDLELPSKVLCQVSFSHFKDALRSDFLRLQTGLKLVLFPLLSKMDREIHDHLLDADMEPFFCLSWILTWFAHDVRDTALVKRLFDAFLVGHPALPIYTALAMMCHPYNRQFILETDCDFAALHQCLAMLPKHSCKVGYKAIPSGFDDKIVMYVSDDEGEAQNERDKQQQTTSAVADTGTIHTHTGDSLYSYLEEERSEFDDATNGDNDSHTFDTRSQFSYNSTMGDSIYTESSFPTSVAGSYSEIHLHQKPTAFITSSSSLASGSLNLQDYGTSSSAAAAESSSSLCPPTDRTMISTEEPDFLSKESTLVSGKWDESWGESEHPEIPIHSSSNINGQQPQQQTSHSVSEEQQPLLDSNAFLQKDRNPVPFESVLDSALQLMKKYPPRSLVGLAKNYFSDDWNSQLSLLGGGGDAIDVQELIGLLDPAPPAWSILPTCSSDWMDKQKQRQDLGLKPTSRKDRRKRKKKKNLAEEVSNNQNDVSFDSLTIDCGAPDAQGETTPTPTASAIQAEDPSKLESDDPMEYVRSHPEDRVVVAIGYGPGMEAKMRQRKLLREKRRRRKRRRALAIGCGVIVIGAVLYSYGLRPSSNETIPERSNSDDAAANSSNNKDAPTPRLRQLRSLEDSKTKNSKLGESRGESTPKEKVLSTSPRAASLTRANSRAMPATGNDKGSLPKSSEGKQSGSFSLRPERTGTLASMTKSAAISTQETKKHSTLTLAHDRSPILDGVVRKTRLFLTRFAHHLWIVCRGYIAFPFRFLTKNSHTSMMDGMQ